LFRDFVDTGSLYDKILSFNIKLKAQMLSFTWICCGICGDYDEHARKNENCVCLWLLDVFQIQNEIVWYKKMKH